VAAISIVVIGGWMMFSEGWRRWRIRAARMAHAQAHAGGEAHAHPAETHALPTETHEHDHATAAHGQGHAVAHDHGAAVAHERDDRTAHEQDPSTVRDHDHEPARGEHSHGGVRHTHLPPPGGTISWRSLFVLGLAGGLIPSASALLILLGSIAAGRPAFGFVLVVAFGLGMALVMSGIGLALVLARGRLERVDSASTLGSVSRALPLVASFLVFGLGIYLTVQAVAGTTTF
jgi:ABC-type nickel/cobalt efflux system permease component RcnA